MRFAVLSLLASDVTATVANPAEMEQELKNISAQMTKGLTRAQKAEFEEVQEHQTELMKKMVQNLNKTPEELKKIGEEAQEMLKKMGFEIDMEHPETMLQELLT